MQTQLTDTASSTLLELTRSNLSAFAHYNLSSPEKLSISSTTSNQIDDLSLVNIYKQTVSFFGLQSDAASLAFEPIFKRYWEYVYNRAISKISSVYAEDLTSATMETLLQRLNGHEEVTNLKGLVNHSFNNEYADILEKIYQGRKLSKAHNGHGFASDVNENITPSKSKYAGAIIVSLNQQVGMDEAGETEMIDLLPDTASDNQVDEAVSRRELLTKLRSLIQEMPERYRAPLVAQWLEGKRIKEVAKELNLSEDQVKHSTARGMKWLQQRLPGGFADWQVA